jgi:pimeloyl-ACP methyl ester carboxylesterase
MSYRIERSTNARGVTFLLSGDLDGSQVADLEALMAAESDRLIFLDLADVTTSIEMRSRFWRVWKRRVPSSSIAPSTCAVGSTRSRAVHKKGSSSVPRGRPAHRDVTVSWSLEQAKRRRRNQMSKATKTRRTVFSVLPIIALVLGYQEVSMSQAKANGGIKNVVLVHGGFVDGSGWQRVYDTLKKDGYTVSVVQNPTISLADDVAVTKRTLAAQDGPAILVGHSYGGVVITEAGNDPKVAGLVYIAAFAPDKGESVSALIKNPPPGAPVPPILPPQDGFLLLDRTKFRASFAADVNADAAAFMADSQVPWGLDALNGAVTDPAWKAKPSWYLVTTEDKMIPPDAQRAMSKRAGSTVVEAKGSHAVYVSQPRAVADLIAKAANGVAIATR